MENLYEKPVRKYRGKNINNLPLAERAETVFNDLLKTLNADLTKVSPAERINAAVQLAAYFLTTKTNIEKNERTN